ncbi:MAG TPA: helix-turn-helix domain-containing protein [Rhizomicrobium sp.]
MSQELYSVEQAASLLGLHVKTVRHYVRDGRLKAVRIGKQYRIMRQDLEALTGTLTDSRRHAEVSSVVLIDAVDKDLAVRVTTSLTAAVKGRPASDAAVRIDTIYDTQRARLKVIVTGSLETTRILLGAVAMLAGI